MISMDVWELSPIGPTGREKSPEECVQRLMGQCWGDSLASTYSPWTRTRFHALMVFEKEKTGILVLFFFHRVSSIELQILIQKPWLQTLATSCEKVTQSSESQWETRAALRHGRRVSESLRSEFLKLRSENLVWLLWPSPTEWDSNMAAREWVTSWESLDLGSGHWAQCVTSWVAEVEIIWQEQVPRLVSALPTVNMHVYKNNATGVPGWHSG